METFYVGCRRGRVPELEKGWIKTSQLQHAATCPHLVAVHSIIVVDRREEHNEIETYLVMDRLAGTMKELLLDPDGAHAGASMELRLSLLADVAAGLAYLHAGSSYHGDVWPGNVLLTAISRRAPVPLAKLTNLGSRAKQFFYDTLITVRTSVYMEPQLYDREAVITTASDVYSFGIMAWQVLTGLQPFEAEVFATLPAYNRNQTMRRYVSGGGRPPLTALAERSVPPDIVALVAACWAPAQDDRPTMAAVQRALEAAAAATASAASPAPPPTLSDEYMVPFGDIKWDKDADDEKIVLGNGTYGIVYAGRLHEQAVAIKYEVIDDPADAAAWAETAVLHMRARCPQIAVMQGAVVRTSADRKTHYYSVLERLAGTLTASLLVPGGAHYGAGMALCLQLLADVAAGLAYLHSRSIIHADVKPDNVLLTAVTPRSTFPTAKLADFGQSVQLRAGAKSRGALYGERGTLVFMDPCLIHPTVSVATASDVYSFGVMAWQVLSGRTPYAAEIAAGAPATPADAVLLLRAHVRGPRGNRPPVSALVERRVPSGVVALVKTCWAPAQRDRPAMAEVQRALEAAAVAAGPLGGGGGGGGGGAPPASTGGCAAAAAAALPSLPAVDDSADLAFMSVIMGSVMRSVDRQLRRR